MGRISPGRVTSTGSATADPRRAGLIRFARTDADGPDDQARGCPVLQEPHGLGGPQDAERTQAGLLRCVRPSILLPPQLRLGAERDRITRLHPRKAGHLDPQRAGRVGVAVVGADGWAGGRGGTSRSSRWLGRRRPPRTTSPGSACHAWTWPRPALFRSKPSGTRARWSEAAPPRRRAPGSGGNHGGCDGRSCHVICSWSEL